VISLRHHAISLAAVFLALAVGVVLGSGLLSDTLVSGLRDDKRQLQDRITGLDLDDHTDWLGLGEHVRGTVSASSRASHP